MAIAAPDAGEEAASGSCTAAAGEATLAASARLVRLLLNAAALCTVSCSAALVLACMTSQKQLHWVCNQHLMREALLSFVRSKDERSGRRLSRFLELHHVEQRKAYLRPSNGLSYCVVVL